MKQPVIHIDPDIQGGVPVPVGPRVPVKNLFDHLEAGDSLEDFLRSFPSVTRDQAVAPYSNRRGTRLRLMRILLDESLPAELQAELFGHEVRTVRDVGWSGLKNGELLAPSAGQCLPHG